MASHWSMVGGSDDEAPAELQKWARTQPSLAAAWAAAPRADWLVRLARRGKLAEPKALTAAACVVARVGGRGAGSALASRELAAAALRSGEPFEDRADIVAGGLRAVLIALAASVPLYRVLSGRGRAVQIAVVAVVYLAVVVAVTALGRLVRRRVVAKAAAAMDDARALTVALTAAERASDAASPGERAAALKLVRERLPAPSA